VAIPIVPGTSLVRKLPGDMYADITAEGVPERFIAILRRLDEPSDEGSTSRRHTAADVRFTVSFGG
jgi:hypothetical protein